MNKRIVRLVATAALVAPLVAAPAGAVFLEVSNSPDGHLVGDTFSVDLIFSGLGNLAAPSLVSYDIFVSYESGLFDLDSVAFGPSLGGPADATSSFSVTPDLVELTESTLLSDADLDALQPDMFTAATLTFMAVTPGMGFKPMLAGGSIALSDGLNGKIAIKKVKDCKKAAKKKKAGTTAGFPTTESECTQVFAVPEPASFFLVLAGLAGLAAAAGSQLARRAWRALLARTIAT